MADSLDLYRVPPHDHLYDDDPATAKAQAWMSTDLGRRTLQLARDHPCEMVRIAWRTGYLARLKETEPADAGPVRCTLSESSDGDTWAGCVLDSGHGGECELRARPQCVREDNAKQDAAPPEGTLRTGSVFLDYDNATPKQVREWGKRLAHDASVLGEVRATLIVNCSEDRPLNKLGISYDKGHGVLANLVYVLESLLTRIERLEKEAH